MEQTILRADVFKQILSGEPFDAVWITCDRRRGTGGELITAEGWMVCSANTQQGQGGSNGRETIAMFNELSKRVDPNHPENGTVNVFNPANAGIHPITVHWDLIQLFNGKRVIN